MQSRGAQNSQLEQSKDKTWHQLEVYSWLMLEIDSDIFSYKFKSRYLIHLVGNVITARSDHNKQEDHLTKGGVQHL
jgi:hypothetical protein